jgi:hypothetical protein
MAYGPRRNTFNPLIVGAIAVIVALAAFLLFREGTDTTEQARIDPPAATSEKAAPSSGPPGPANVAPTTPNTPAAKQPQPGAQQ